MKTSRASAQARVHGQRDTTLLRARRSGSHRSTDDRGARILERIDASLDVVTGEDAMPVDANDDLTPRNGKRTIEAGGLDPVGIVDDPHRTELAGDVPRAVSIPSVGDEDLQD